MKFINTFAAVSVATAMTFASTASAATANFNITATIIKALSVTNTTGMGFGVIASPTVATSYVLPAGGEAVFTVVGEPGNNVTPSVSTSSVTLTCTSGACLGTGATMTVDTFTLSGDLPSGSKVLPAGTGTFNNAKVSATLRIGANQATGIYSGSNTYAVIYG